jgi:hypothetical protein
MVNFILNGDTLLIQELTNRVFLPVEDVDLVGNSLLITFSSKEEIQETSADEYFKYLMRYKNPVKYEDRLFHVEAIKYRRGMVDVTLEEIC